MITKQAKQTAEQLAPKVAELWESCQKIAVDWLINCDQYAQAANLWKTWQYFRGYEARTDNPNEQAKAAVTFENNPREWSQTVGRYAEEKERARVSLFVARVNFNNYLNYIAQELAEMVRPYWRQFASRRGFEDLGELLAPKCSALYRSTVRQMRPFFKISGGNIYEATTAPAFIRLDVSIFLGEAVGISGHVQGVRMGEDMPNEPQEIKKPHLLTIKEYKEATEKLNNLKEKARQTLNKCAADSFALVESLGLADYIEYLAGGYLSFKNEGRY